MSETESEPGWGPFRDELRHDKPSGQPLVSGPDVAGQAPLHPYAWFCMGALGVVVLALSARGSTPSNLIPLGVGALGLYFRWGMAPVLVALVTGACLLITGEGGAVPVSTRPLELSTWFVCAGTLAYIAGHYRLQSLTTNILPPETTKLTSSGTGQAVAGLIVRPSFDPNEMGWLLFQPQVLALAAMLIMRMVPERLNEFGIARGLWQLIVIGWAAGLAVVVARGILAYLGWRNMSQRQARMTLQDMTWLEIGSEQRRINQWLAWRHNRRES